jgi:hypothetical protein
MTRLAAKKWQIHGMKRRRGIRETMAACSGFARNIASIVPVISHGSLSAPRAIPIVSRTGRSR